MPPLPTKVYVKGTVDHINRPTSHDLTTKEYLDKGNILLNDDHDKTCRARYATCTCGYEARLENYIEQALAEIVRLNEEIVALKKKPIGTQP